MALNLCVTAIFQFKIYYLINHICVDYIYSPYEYLYNLIEKMKIPNPRIRKIHLKILCTSIIALFAKPSRF